MSVLCSMVGASFVTAAAEVLRAKKGIQAFGNAQVSTAQSQFGGSSFLGDGTGDYLLITSHSDFAFGTGDFTIEAWVRPTNFTSGPIIVDFRTGDPQICPTLYINTSGVVLYYTNGATRITGSTLSINTWYHIALCRSSASTKLFVNGTQVGSTYSDTNNYVEKPAYISAYGGGTTFGNLNGYIDEFRISNTARYTANFTSSTTPFVNDANTVLLLHMDGTNTSTFFEDDNGVGRSQVGMYAVGNAKISTAQSKFNGASALFDGTGDVVVVPKTTALSLTYTQTFTIEFWIRSTTPATQSDPLGAHEAYNSPYAGWDFSIVSSKINFYNGSTFSAFNNALSANTWYHVAVVSTAGSIKMYQDGVQQTVTPTLVANFNNTVQPITVGAAYSDGLRSVNGYIDEVRISNIARYTATFTPTTTPFVNDANTLLLMHMDGTNASTVFRDDNGVGRSQIGISALGNAQIDTAQSKFGGSSALFDGTGDYLIINPYFDLGSSNYTMEAWIRTTVQNERIILAKYASAYPNGFDWTFNLSASGKIIFQWYDGAFKFVTGATTISTNTWHHVAVVRNGSSLKLYLNGTEDGSGTATDIRPGLSTIWVGAYQDSTPTASWNGHLDEIRVSNTARYTTTFTPATTPFQNDSNTLLLMHMDGTDASTVFIDDNGVYPA